jgi:hypothetical protein
MYRGDISEKELTACVHISRVIIQKYLHHFRNSVTILCANIGLSPTDIAYDCLGEVFSRDEKHGFRRIEEFVLHLEKELAMTSETELFFAYEGLLRKVTDAHLARLYAQADPAGSKIHRNIRDSVNKTGHFSLQKDFRGTVLFPTTCDMFDHLEEFPLDTLATTIIQQANSRMTTEEQLSLLYHILVSQSRYRRSIPLSDVVQILKKIYFKESAAALNEDGEMDIAVQSSGLAEFEIEHIRRQVENMLKEKIFFTYFVHKKIDKKEAESLFFALQDVIADWMFSHDGQGNLRDYLQRHLPLNDETYKSVFELKLKYLIKIAKEEFARRLTVEL